MSARAGLGPAPRRAADAPAPRRPRLSATALAALPYALARERLARERAPRTPEPMTMDEPESVAAFDAGGARGGQIAPVYRLNALAIGELTPPGGRVLDLGSGSGRLLTLLARRRPDIEIVGLELSRRMLARGHELLERERLGQRVTLRRGDMTAFAERPMERVELVCSVMALHHLPSADALRACLKQIACVRRETGCAVWLFDLVRLKDSRSGAALLSLVGGWDPALWRDALASERAAFTRGELRRELARAGLAELRQASPRLVPGYQAHWVERVASANARPADSATARAGATFVSPRERAIARLAFSGLPRARPQPASRSTTDAPASSAARRAPRRGIAPAARLRRTRRAPSDPRQSEVLPR